MQDACLRGDDVFLDFGMLLGIMKHRGGGAFHVGNSQNGSLALQVRHHDGIGILLLQLHDRLHGEFLMHMTSTVPEQHTPARDTVDVVAKVVVGAKDDLLALGEAVDDLLGIAAGHHTIRQRLHCRRGVHIAHHLVTRMLLLVFLQVFSLAAVRQRTSGIEVGAQHGLVRTQELAGLRHEMHAAHHHHLGIGLGSLAGKGEGVAHEVGNVLYLAHRIVVRQDNRILLLAEPAYLLFQVQRLVDRFIDVSFLYPFFFHHNIYIIFLYFLILKKRI